jgi:hypothetical protein
MCLHVHSNGIFSKNTTIAHPETGLFLDYVGVYTPAQAIIHNSAFFPMTTATCHFIPLSAAENIPSCNITGKRHKRAIPVLIPLAIAALGAGTLSAGMSLSNSMQMSSLQKQVALVERSLTQFSKNLKINAAYLAKIELKQIELVQELQVTQKALNAMAPILNSHTNTIKDIVVGYEKLRLEFRHSFLYLAMTEIFRKKFTLAYLSSDDVHKVVYEVIKQGNLTFQSHQRSLPLAQIITKLLVHQQIDFMPSAHYISENPDEIGRLIITNYFAAPQLDQTLFYIYKLLAIPFFHENETIQLAQMPHYWAINPKDNTTIEWHDPEESGCELQLMTTCRDTPPFRTISRDTCFDQIVGGLALTKCRTTPIPRAPFFLRELRDNFWITSSPVSIHCLKTPRTEYFSAIQQPWSMSEEIILPPVAIVNVTPDYVFACPGFTLTGGPIASNASSLVLFYNSSMITANVSVFDINRYINSNTTWFKRALDDREIKNLMNFIHDTSTLSTIHNSLSIHMWSYVMLIFSCILFGLGASLVYCAFRRKQRNNLQNL